MITISLQNEKSFTIPNEQSIGHWVNQAIQQSGHRIVESQAHILIRIIDKTESAELNHHFRHRTGPTNILSFPDQDFDGIPADSLGDLAICAELVEEEAQNQQKTSTAHWAHLIIHGTLHLLGFDHIKTEEATRMEALEIEILQSLNFSNPYIT